MVVALNKTHTRLQLHMLDDREAKPQCQTKKAGDHMQVMLDLKRRSGPSFKESMEGHMVAL